MNVTPLKDVPWLSPEQRGELESQWILSLESLCDAVGAIPPGEERTRFLASSLGRQMAGSLAPWLAGGVAAGTAPVHGLGLRIPAPVLSRLGPGRTPPLAARRLSPASAGPVLPSQVNLAPRFPPVRNQGSRGTCVAFASTALREYVAAFDHRFSEQFCYWACKQFDADQQEGTTLRQATAVLERLGACEDRWWPYSPEPRPGNEGHHPPPPEAERSARRFRLAGWPMLRADDVGVLRQTLAGTAAAPGSPVVIGVAVYASSFYSATAAASGNITLPFPSEGPVGAHAMCAVGYQDDPAAPGGGYFIVRNSWGRDWAARNPRGAGHALLPYAYLAEFCFEAFAAPPGPAFAGPDPDRAEAGDPLAPYLAFRAADAPAPERREWLGYRDTQAQGGRLPEGREERVLCHPLRPREFRADTPENREVFIRQWGAWSEEGAGEVARAVLAALPADRRECLEASRRGRRRYLEAIDHNLVSAAGRPFPHVREPWMVRLAPYEWEPKIRSVRLVADLTEAWLDRWEERHRPAGAERWPAAIREVLGETHGLRLYAVEGWRATALVLAGWFTPAVYRWEAGRPVFASLPWEGTPAELARQVLADWRRTAPGREPVFTFATFGFAGPASHLPPALGPVVSSRHWEMYWTHAPDGVLVTALPDRVTDRLALRDFADQLLPVTFRERVSQVKEIIDSLRADDFRGTIQVDLVRRRTAERQCTSSGERVGCRQSVVLDAFLQLQELAPENYRVVKAGKDDDLSRGGAKVGLVRMLRGAQEGERVTVTSVRKRFLRKHGLRLLSMLLTGVLGLALGQWNEQLKLSSFQSFLLSLPFAYLGNILGGWINRRADRSSG